MAREIDGVVALPQHSFSAGEVTPDAYGRQDLAKYHAGCAVLQNWFVHPQGGVQVRPGDQYIGTFGSSGRGRLWPFQFSPAIGQTYMLAFSDQKLRFIKNPGTVSYPNASNAGFITVAGSPYELSTPYLEADLRSLHFLQIADVMWITARGYPRKKLKRFSDTSWTLTDITTTPTIAPPVITGITISALPTGATDPATTRYMYVVSAVNEEGDESLPSVPLLSGPGINISATQGTVTVNWTPVTGAKYYKVYKALPAHGDRVPNPSEQFGFVGFAYGTVFTDSNIVADFAHSPIQPDDPFAPGRITGYSISNPGTGFPPSGSTVTVTDATGSGAVIYPIISTNVSTETGGIAGLYIADPGRNYSSPTVSAAGGSGFVATLTVGPSTGIEPAVVGVNQQRLVYASTDNKPNSIFASRPGKPDDYRSSNPTVDSDSFEFAIFDQQVTRVNWLRSMPGGLLIGTDAGVMQLTGGSSSPSNPAAITPTNAVIVPQSYYGAADIQPIVIDYDVLFVQKEGIIRDLQYNFFANIYTGTDLTTLSAHFFEGISPVEWAYQDVPNKIIWIVTTNGWLYSLTYLKTQEIFGWARHTAYGNYESVATVQEGDINAVYLSVNVDGVRQIRRQTTQIYFQDSDAWQLDSALSITPTFPQATLTLATASGNGVLASTDDPVFSSGDVGKEIHSVASMATVVGFIDTTHVRVDINPLKPFGQFEGASTAQPIPPNFWRMDPPLHVMTGLGHLEGKQVYALVNGEKQGPLMVLDGSIHLDKPGSQVVVGLAYPAFLQPLWADPPGAETIQNKRKKAAAATIRVRDAKGLKYGTTFAAAREWVNEFTSTDDPVEILRTANGLWTGDQRITVNQDFGTGGWVCVKQDAPYPATVLFIVPELALGDP